MDRRFVSGAIGIGTLLPASILRSACHRSNTHDDRIQIVRIETIGITETRPHLGTHTTLTVFTLGTIRGGKAGTRFDLALPEALLLCRTKNISNTLDDRIDIPRKGAVSLPPTGSHRRAPTTIAVGRSRITVCIGGTSWSSLESSSCREWTLCVIQQHIRCTTKVKGRNNVDRIGVDIAVLRGFFRESSSLSEGNDDKEYKKNLHHDSSIERIQ